jgi:hypothetical protein
MQPEADIQLRLKARADALGIALPAEDREAVLAGARWLRDGLDRLRREGLAP